MPRFRKFAIAVVVAVSTTVALLAIEVGLRVWFPQKLSVNVTQWDPDVGFVNIPGAEGYGERLDYRMHVTINSKGLRDREFPEAKPAGTKRIGVFGDSFTFGEGVQNHETYAKRLESILNQPVARSGDAQRVEVLNFGIGKTGTSHQLAWYRKAGAKYDLDVVVVAFLAANDFEDNWGGVYSLQGQQLVHNPTSYSFVRRVQSVLIHMPAYRWLAQNSHLVNLMRASATQLDDQRRTRQARMANAGTQARDAGDLLPEKYELTLNLLRAFRSDVETAGASFHVATVATLGERLLEHYDTQTPAPPYAPYLKRLLGVLADEDFNVLDTIPRFENDQQSTTYFLPYDKHFNAAGHAAFAVLLADQLTGHRARAGSLRIDCSTALTC